ncbi:MAG: BamA/TamA family outer membrane protein [Steroidobacteraceae bacterium]
MLLIVLSAYSYLAIGADPQGYRVDIASTGSGEMDATLKSSSDLSSLRTSAPVSPFGLIARARSDIDRLTTVLESYGYYQSAVAIKINHVPLKDPGLRDVLSALPKGTDALVQVAFTLGPLYHLGRIDIDGELPDLAGGKLALSTGDAAVAGAVLAAGARLQNALQEQGYAFAKVDAPVAYEAAGAPVLDLTFHVVTGPRVNVGDIHIGGLQRTHESLLRNTLRLRTGEPFRLSAVERGRRDLLALGVFSQVIVQVGTAVDDSGGVPITFKVRERLRHAATVSAAYSSDLGGSGGVTWTDRNLFGNAETLNIAARMIDLGGSDTTGVGYDTSVKFSKPDFLVRDQSLQVSVGALKQSLQAYDQTSTTAGVSVMRKLSGVWNVSVGLTTTTEKIIQPVDDVIVMGLVVVPSITYYYTLVALPLIVSYDSTDLPTPLDDPRHGFRGSFSLTPTVAIGHPDSTFIIEQLQVAGYFDLNSVFGTDPGRSVVAARALAGVAKGAGEFSLPPDQRFYGGGSATIRGYRYQSVGPVFPGTEDPIGGTEIEAAGAEFRQRLGGNFGAAAFVDGGQVTASASDAPHTFRISVPNTFRIGVGLGLRYYTPIGPVRLDIAVPTKRRSTDDSFEIYIGLGQAY